VNVDGPLGVVIEVGFVVCMVVLLVFLIQQFRRTGKGD
jgi:hypothetical protein